MTDLIATKKNIKILYRKLNLNLNNKLDLRKLEIEKTISYEKLTIKMGYWSLC